MYGIGKIFEKKYCGLIFALVSGLAYFFIILDYIIKTTKNGALLLGSFFFPTIVAGAALIILKTINRLNDEENYRAINIIIYLHILLILLSFVFLFDIINTL